MGAIALSNPFQICVRRIGYSVGLEFLRERVCDIVDLYAAKGDIAAHDWERLVTAPRPDGWGRREDATQHIADFMAELGVLRRHHRKIEILRSLEVFSIVVRGLNTNAQGAFPFLAPLILASVVEADGDVFLNAVASAFDDKRFLELLQDALAFKRDTLKDAFPQATMLRYIDEAVSVRLKDKASSTTAGKRFNAADLKNKLFPDQRIEAAGPSEDDDVWKDYLRKVPGRRKSWAADLGVFDADGPTEVGAALLRRLAAEGLCLPSGAFAFWPYTHEAARLHAGIPRGRMTTITPWALLEVCVRSFGHEPEPFSDSLDLRLEFAADLQEVLSLLRRGSPRGALQHDLPIFIAAPAVTGLRIGRGRRPYSFAEQLHAEFRRADRLLDHIRIQGTEGGIAFTSPRSNVKA
jgi:hypothetical protein